ncbi:VOC family protein [Paenibacillus sp. sptzw28]|uniref:VOC family protein n=1 Tax=Paenibacillus sp. sptzw28 TaxID=715179 RepID=UPI001C6DDBF1|nr:VOC family protein [Paenibacillus sp. sptzw28]QYR20756.1 VOC family protein [Paenibacillus sp. sptzw28]
MSHPILPFMPTVFIPVRELKKSIEWYCGLLEMPVQPAQDGGGIYYFKLDGTDIILDSNMWGFPPMIMYDTRDIDAAYAFCREQEYAHMGEFFRYPNVAHFSVGGSMICQVSEGRAASDNPRPAHPLLQRIARVLVHTDDIKDMEQWYEKFLNKTVESDPWVEGLTGIRMSYGAHLLIDDNRLSRTEKIRYEKLQLDLRANPVAIIETPDIEAARSHVIAKGASNVSGIETRSGLTQFTFYDPDRNGLMVCESK